MNCAKHGEYDNQCAGCLDDYAAAMLRLTTVRVLDPVAIRTAAMALYMAGRWSCDRPVDEAKLWADLRDALGLNPGTATALGVDDTHLSTQRADA